MERFTRRTPVWAGTTAVTVTIAVLALLLAPVGLPAAGVGGEDAARAGNELDVRVPEPVRDPGEPEPGQDPGELVREAELLVRSASELEPTDPAKGETLRLAARLYHHAGRHADAYRVMVASGLALHRAGQELLAAHAFVDAAEVALAMRNATLAWSAADRAGAVLRASSLAPSARASVLDRVRFGDAPRRG